MSTAQPSPNPPPEVLIASEQPISYAEVVGKADQRLVAAAVMHVEVGLVHIEIESGGEQVLRLGLLLVKQLLGCLRVAITAVGKRTFEEACGRELLLDRTTLVHLRGN